MKINTNFRFFLSLTSLFRNFLPLPVFIHHSCNHEIMKSLLKGNEFDKKETR